MAEDDEYGRDQSDGRGRFFGSFGMGRGFHHRFGGQEWRMQFGQKGWLRPVVLKLLSQKPMNGVELMGAVQDMSHGWMKPSPGSVYPLLETLTTEGLIRKRDDGKYEIEKKYSAEFGPQGEIDEMLTEMEGNVSYLEELSQGGQAKLSKYKKRLTAMAGRLSKL